MTQGGVFAETQRQELERQAEAGEDRTDGHQPALGLSSLALAAFGATKEGAQGRGPGQDDLGAVCRQDPEAAFPAHGLVEVVLVSGAQAVPEGSPEGQGQLLASLAKGFFADPGGGQLGTDGADPVPGLDQALGHRLGMQRDQHHQPGNDFRDERARLLGSTAGLLGHRREVLGSQKGLEAGESPRAQKHSSTLTG